jgi:hypothetical protein
MFNDGIVLVNPNKDASENEIYFRNGFNSPANNIFRFVNAGDRFIMNSRNVFKPEKLGNYTKDYTGTYNSIVQRRHLPDF